MVSKDKTIVTFHSGILTIGGTVIEVSHGNSHIFFDFGTEFRPELDLPDEQLQTLIQYGIIPQLNHVYDPRLGYKYDGEETEEYENTAVFLSHAHLDHSRMINYLDPAIPLYTLKETKMILNSLNRNGDFLLPTPFEKSPFTREMIGLEPNAVITVGDISVEVVPVDHDAYGASALLIRTPDHFITYTGDLRLHGYIPEATVEFCKKAKHTQMLMMEGVTISFPERPVDPTEIKPSNELEVIEKVVQFQQENPNRPIAFNGYPANVERFAKIVEESPRTVVLEAHMAALLQEVFGIHAHYYYSNEANQIPELNPNLEVSYQTLIDDQEQYFWQVVDNFDKLQEGTLYLHCDAQPLGDFDPNYQVFLDLLAKHHIEFVKIACSGHAKPADLDRIIAMIEPQLLVPIHTLKPEILENPYGERILPHRGEKIVL